MSECFLYRDSMRLGVDLDYSNLYQEKSAPFNQMTVGNDDDLCKNFVIFSQYKPNDQSHRKTKMSLNSWNNFEKFRKKSIFSSTDVNSKFYTKNFFPLNNKQAKGDLSNHRRISVWVNQPADKCKHFHGMSPSESHTKIYSFQIKFGVFHQKVTVTTTEQHLSMKTLHEVAIRFIQTMVIFVCLFVHISSVYFKCPDQDVKLFHNRILLFRYEPLSYQMLIPLNLNDIRLADTIVEVIISRK